MCIFLLCATACSSLLHHHWFCIVPFTENLYNTTLTRSVPSLLGPFSIETVDAYFQMTNSSHVEFGNPVIRNLASFGKKRGKSSQWLSIFADIYKRLSLLLHLLGKYLSCWDKIGNPAHNILQDLRNTGLNGVVQYAEWGVLGSYLLYFQSIGLCYLNYVPSNLFPMIQVIIWQS